MTNGESLSSREARNRAAVSLLALGASALVGIGLIVNSVKQGHVVEAAEIGLATLGVLTGGGIILNRINDDNLRRVE